MDDLNDFALFAAVVVHGNFSAAGRALGFPKSKVSRRIGELERRLGVRLLQRSTRAVALTEVGAEFFKHCDSITRSVKSALEVAERATQRPSGRIRVSCPVGVAYLFLSSLLPRFLAAEPDVQIELELTSRRVDVIAEGFDIALRVRSTLEDSDLVVRNFGDSQQLLVASAAFLANHGPFPSLESLQGVAGAGPKGTHGQPPRWKLSAADGTVASIDYRAVLVTDDIHLLYDAALAGLGVAQLPIDLCQDAIDAGRLVALLPEHRLAAHRLHAVYPSRRGMVPAVRAFIDYLTLELPSAMVSAGQYRAQIEPNATPGAAAKA
ncbi:LysR family transcriptional regulator [Xanthomonas tesorieronis]|uniref:LysR family transcriptional regulator n=1 Tax=Xanthomonas tesorieronis TaxID=3160839 RepID=UPI0035183B9A